MMALLPRRTAASTANSAVCSGGNAIVYEATDRETGEKWALKVIDRAVVTLEDSNQVAHAFLRRRFGDCTSLGSLQAELLKKVNHKNIIHLKDVLQTRSHLYLVWPRPISRF